MKAKFSRIVFAFLVTLLALSIPALGECADSAASADVVEVEIEYGGKLISVDMADVILMSDGRGGQTLEPE
jgi:hypothetical protein